MRNPNPVRVKIDTLFQSDIPLTLVKAIDGAAGQDRRWGMWLKAVRSVEPKVMRSKGAGVNLNSTRIRGLAVAVVCSLTATHASAGGLTARVYKFASDKRRPFETFIKRKVDPTIVFDTNLEPDGSLRNNVAIRWTGYLIPPTDGPYQIGTCSDDGVRVYFDGRNVIDRFTDMGATMWSGNLGTLQAGKKYKIRIDYFQGGGGGYFRLFYKKAGSFFAADNKSCLGLSSAAQIDGNMNYDSSRHALFNVPESMLAPEDDSVEAANTACNVAPLLLDPASLPVDYVTDPNVQRALRLFKRLTGMNASIFDSRIKTMRGLIADGHAKDAARVATADPSFYDITVKQLASKIATREQTPDPNLPLNDFIATYIGVVRDRIDARKLLTGKFLYRGRQDAPERWADDAAFDRKSTMETNDHYLDIEKSGVPLRCALDEIKDLARVPASFLQKFPKPGGLQSDEGDLNSMTSQYNDGAAGVLTSRAWGEAHVIAGTNRRPVEKSFEHFLCSPISEWRDAATSDDRVGRDVARLPGGGDHQQYLTQCKSCHAGMDSLRGAWSYWNFENGVLKFSPFFNREDYRRTDEQQDTVKKGIAPYLTYPNGPDSPFVQNFVDEGNSVVKKLNHNPDSEIGYILRDNSFVNQSNERANRDRFGFSTNLSGRGLPEFGRMIANSDGFPRCNAVRVYREVCKKDPLAADASPALKSWINEIAKAHADGGYNLKDLFETIAINCMEE